MPREDCYACEALLTLEGKCPNQECSTQPCLQCGKKTCDCPPLTAKQKVDLRAERDQKAMAQALTRAANERLFPTKKELPTVRQLKADMAKRPKVLMSERRARSQAQFNAIRKIKD